MKDMKIMKGEQRVQGSGFRGLITLCPMLSALCFSPQRTPRGDERGRG